MKMEQPKFPEEFVKNHCPKVLEARGWRKTLNAEGSDESDTDYAECAFVSAGAGMKCENCRAFLTRPFLGHEVDREFLPQIEEYYQKVKEYDDFLKQQELITHSFGSGI